MRMKSITMPGREGERACKEMLKDAGGEGDWDAETGFGRCPDGRSLFGRDACRESSMRMLC
jgi:hypothetical protein